MSEHATSTPIATTPQSPKQLYMSTTQHHLIDTPTLHHHLTTALTSLTTHPDLTVDLPTTYDRATIHATLTHKYKQTLDRYHAYLHRRSTGGQREMFPNRPSALYYIEQIAPTKLVDGSWLYQSLTPAAYTPTSSTGGAYIDVSAMLRKIYVEEAGDGVAHMNHVAIYKQLLHKYALNTDLHLIPDDMFTQGAIQLALGYCEQYLPEAVGYNLGYEQLPYHLLVETYELDELGIDNYYFQLHVTIDNTANGHAKQAIDAVVALMDHYAADPVQQAHVYQRVRNGMLLGELGPSCNSIVQSFDYKTELYKSIAHKSNIAHGIHMKAVKIGQYSLNEWLDPERCGDLRHVANLFDSMVSSGYISKGRPAHHSKFWQYASSATNGVMYGVFSYKERELIKLYIEDTGDDNSNTAAQHHTAPDALSTSESTTDSHIDSLIDKYLGSSLAQHKHVTLPDPDTHQYVSIADLYHNKRDRLQQSMSRFTVRKAMHDSFCFGRMKRVMPEQDKQKLLNWLGVFDNKLDERVTQETELDAERKYKDVMNSTNRYVIHNKANETVFVNTLLTVLARYVTPLNHWTNRGVLVTAIHTAVIAHVSPSTIDSELYAELDQYNYWLLIAIALQCMRHTALDSTIDVDQLIEEHVSSQADRDVLDSAMEQVRSKLTFDDRSPASSPRRVRRSFHYPPHADSNNNNNNNSTANTAEPTTVKPRDWLMSQWMTVGVTLFTVFMLTPIFRVIVSQQ